MKGLMQRYFDFCTGTEVCLKCETYQKEIARLRQKNKALYQKLKKYRNPGKVQRE
jgi:hypothetical protein